jgi:hypothetical protein
MPAIASFDHFKAAQKEGLGVCAMPYLSSKAETNAPGDALCSMCLAGVGWRSEHKNDSKERQPKK